MKDPKFDFTCWSWVIRVISPRFRRVKAFDFIVHKILKVVHQHVDVWARKWIQMWIASERILRDSTTRREIANNLYSSLDLREGIRRHHSGRFSECFRLAFISIINCSFRVRASSIVFYWNAIVNFEDYKFSIGWKPTTLSLPWEVIFPWLDSILSNSSKESFELQQWQWILVSEHEHPSSNRLDPKI